MYMYSCCSPSQWLSLASVLSPPSLCSLPPPSLLPPFFLPPPSILPPSSLSLLSFHLLPPPQLSMLPSPGVEKRNPRPWNDLESDLHSAFDDEERMPASAPNLGPIGMLHSALARQVHVFTSHVVMSFYNRSTCGFLS